MKNVLRRLEKSNNFWILLALSFAFFLLRLPSLAEPHWYGDEGIYQVIGMAIRRGRILYTGIWDNKPPLLYLIYAIFDGNQFWVRTFSLLVGILTVIAFYFLAQLLFRKRATTLWTTALFGFLLATPFLEGNIANAENFLLLPVISAAFIFLTTTKRRKPRLLLFLSGLLLGLAFITKVVAVFDLSGLIVFAYLLSVQDKNKGRLSYIGTVLQMFRRYRLFAAGFLVPLVFTCLYFLSVQAITPFINATFFSNIGYVGYGNHFLFPQGLLVVKLILLIGFLACLFLKRNYLSDTTLFILVWLAFSLFNAFFSERPYTHYILVLLPSFILFIGWIFSSENRQGRIVRLISGLLLLGLVFYNFHIPTVNSVTSYYANYLAFVTGNKSVTSYQSSFDKRTPEVYNLALFIKMHTTDKDSVFVWGNSAQIYVLSGILPPGRFTVAYHVIGNSQHVRETALAVYKAYPKYIITLDNVPYLPFQINGYRQTYATDNALIYERSN